MIGGYVKNTSNCEGLPLGWDENVEIIENLGNYKSALVQTGNPLRKRRIVGWSDLFFGQPVSIDVYRARWNEQEGILICGGNSGIRILANKNDKDVRTEYDEHLPNGWGTPILWIEDESDLISLEGEASFAAAVLGSKGGSATSEAKQKASRENGKLGGRPSKAQPTQRGADGENVA